MILGLADRIAANMGPQTLAAVYQQSPGWLVEQIRMYRFRQTVRYAAAHSEFYRTQFKRRGIDARQVRRPADLGDFYTTPDDIVATRSAGFMPMRNSPAAITRPISSSSSRP